MIFWPFLICTPVKNIHLQIFEFERQPLSSNMNPIWVRLSNVHFKCTWYEWAWELWSSQTLGGDKIIDWGNKRINRTKVSKNVRIHLWSSFTEALCKCCYNLLSGTNSIVGNILLIANSKLAPNCGFLQIAKLLDLPPCVWPHQHPPAGSLFII